jgi:hypothetical protein
MINDIGLQACTRVRDASLGRFRGMFTALRRWLTSSLVPVASLHRASFIAAALVLRIIVFKFCSGAFGSRPVPVSSAWSAQCCIIPRRFPERCCGVFNLVVSSSAAVSTRVVAQQALGERLAQSRSRLKLNVEAVEKVLI